MYFEIGYSYFETFEIILERQSTLDFPIDENAIGLFTKDRLFSLPFI